MVCETMSLNGAAFYVQIFNIILREQAFNNNSCVAMITNNRRLLLLLFFFFFSSRRRHTRSKRDWSSDVCSSDLIPPWRRMGRLRRRPKGRPRKNQKVKAASTEIQPPFLPAASPNSCGPFNQRSEERRVGKECRSRRSPDH